MSKRWASIPQVCPCPARVPRWERQANRDAQVQASADAPKREIEKTKGPANPQKEGLLGVSPLHESFLQDS